MIEDVHIWRAPPYLEASRLKGGRYLGVVERYKCRGALFWWRTMFLSKSKPNLEGAPPWAHVFSEPLIED